MNADSQMWLSAVSPNTQTLRGKEFNRTQGGDTKKKQLEELKNDSNCMRVKPQCKTSAIWVRQCGISKKCCTQKKSLSSKNEGTLESDTRPLMPREAALVAGISSMTKNVMDRINNWLQLRSKAILLQA